MNKDISRIGAQLYTVREYMSTFKDIENTFRKIKDIGYEAVQFSGQPIKDAAELWKIADDTGIKIICTHIPYDDFKNNLSRVVKEHHILGATHAGVGVMPKEYTETAEAVVRFTKEFDDIAVKLKQEGLGTTYHNHRFEFSKLNGRTIIDLMLENSACFSFMMDTYWVQSGGADVVDFIRKNKSRFELVHFKDMLIKDNQQEMCEIFEGNLNWSGIIDEIVNSDVQYAFVEQDTCRENPFDCLRTSYNNLKKFMEA